MPRMTIGNASEPTLWEGASESLAAAATKGKAAARYRVTPQHIYAETGLVTTNSQQVPILAVRDVDVTASMSQKARKVSTVLVHLTSQPQPMVLDSVKDGKRVRDIINQAVHDARAAHQRAQTTQYHQGTPVIPAPAAPSGGSVVEQLKALAALREAGVLTDEEFATQKAKILG